MELSRAKILIQKHREGTLTEQEKSLLESWYLDLAKTDRKAIGAEELGTNLDAVWEALPVYKLPETVETGKMRPMFRYTSVAASILLLCSLGVYFFYNQPKVPTAKEITYAADTAPGDNKAILTLAGGAEIMLDKEKNGELAREGNMTILKTSSGEVVYQPLGRKMDGKDLSYNTITTPKAGQYQVRLPDGTKAWLNAASSIRFPTSFPENERVVEIMGEVYFEVAKVTIRDKRVPFKVLAGKQLVEVLGTHFNINSYKDEGNIKTTLVEGSIKVRMAGNFEKGIFLRPGQQSQLIGSGRKATDASSFNVKEVDASAVVAWKNGFFRFDNVGLPELMRQLSRWYDMEVVYVSPIKDHEFVGQIERTAPLSKVLKILEMGDVHFRVEGKKIIVTD